MFPVFSVLLTRLDPLQLSAERYILGGAVLLALVALREGPRALRTEGHAVRIGLLGLIGVSGYNVLVPAGVALAGPQHGALWMATIPALALVVETLRTRTAPPPARIPFVAAAFAGVAIVIVARGLHTGAALGDALLFLGALSWVIFTIGATTMRDWSPLRFTALAASFGGIALALAAAVATQLGLSQLPTLDDYRATAPGMAFLVFGGAVYAVAAWTSAVRGLGAQRAALFMNVVPIVAFAVAIAGGTRPSALEIGGALLTIVALAGDNLTTARRAQPLIVDAAHEPPVGLVRDAQERAVLEADVVLVADEPRPLAGRLRPPAFVAAPRAGELDDGLRR
jgi:drug/metabolite transporter (DMT)-like permease